MSCLSLRGVGKRYERVVVLDDINLDMSPGSRTSIVGPSGSGKTTLLRIIAGFEAPDTGDIDLDGRELANGSTIIPAHRRGIGFVTQDGSLFPHLSVADNIGFGLKRGTPGRDRRILDLMRAVDLDTRMLERRPHQLSGGQQQRVALARALARQPKLMLLDEPFSALDTALRESTRKMVTDVLRNANITTVLVTHDQAEALSFADQVAVLRNGRLAQVGSPRELYLSPRDAETAVFMGDAIILPARLGNGWADCALGRVRAETGQRRGDAVIMIRPEQIRFVAAADEGSVETGGLLSRHGRVTAVEFGGATALVTVGFVGAAPGTMEFLSIKSSGAELPAPGSTIRTEIISQAHVFCDPAPACEHAPKLGEHRSIGPK
ncbi:Vitamin B12 import ATP-binding protein BtuD [Pleomorphomonas sp. T1.2MG-36]|uniref:ABC transporter ATP-binding protein n=1 Tax=Pleomorphomonas sp. T1.2MG-36 TaxID=3041167 RepID=UPI002477715C|nr:ABC transporter ATP-binding protein [Pleomorphomonas sp. T1.2MG-36]CAI9418708.1 Vitamin B12 import ATP-binding protein BtuD [Pleomorphomonas sp. T1.2MG-36]